jgi:predicted CXXCH cytochrome family protein
MAAVAVVMAWVAESRFAGRVTAQDVGGAVRHRDSQPAAAPTLVGREVCRQCHADNYQLHASHGHASTFARVSETDIASRYDGKTFDGGEPYGKYTYQADDQGRLFVRLPDKFGDEPFPLQFALGSGPFTLLTLLPDAVQGGTAGIEHRVTCYHQDRLGISPGHANKKPRSGVEFFGDTARGEALERCVYCHTTSAKIANQDIVDLVASVNCEKCHGPGSEHVRQARASKTPPPFSVGREDWDVESEFQLCGDCHRLPRSITEKELREYPDLLARFQPIGLLRSKCYLESDRQLKCTTCHSPHASLQSTTVAQHEQNCIQCHRENQQDHVVCPVSPQDGCIKCHMRAVSQEQGLTFHDHWIRVLKSE